MISEVLYLLLSLALLVFSGHILVRSLSHISNFLRISQFSAAFIFMAFSTSIPELFVGISSAMQGIPEISLGNVIGSNIANITLVAGLGSLIAGGMPLESKTLKRDSLYMLLASIIPMILMTVGGVLSRIDGILLIFVYIGYNWILVKEGRHFSKNLVNRESKLEVVVAPAMFVIALVILFISSIWAVHWAGIVASGLGISNLVVGLVLIALGTSLPELSFTISSLLHKKGELSLGNLIGSVIANSTLILGVTSIITPIKGMSLILLLSTGFMIFSLFLFSTFVERADKFTRKEGLSLLLLYILFVVVQVYLPA